MKEGMNENEGMQEREKFFLFSNCLILYCRKHERSTNDFLPLEKNEYAKVAEWNPFRCSERIPVNIGRYILREYEASGCEKARERRRNSEDL